jgi:ElaB/YqjD/DUF883 family membrane-anchored ribosome-binding protein
MSATLEERVSVLERDVSQLKSRAGVSEPRQDAIESDLAAIPDLIKAESRLSDSRIARLRSDITSEMADFRAEMNERFDAVIRAIAEIVVEKPRKA